MGSIFSINGTNYQHIHIDFFNIIQPAWDTEWIIAGDVAHKKDMLAVKILAEHLKTVYWKHQNV